MENIMKMTANLIVIAALSLPLFAHAQSGFDACKPVFEACAAQNFKRDDTAPAGKKIWSNCVDVILNKKKPVEKVGLDPNGKDANYCRDYRAAKDKFDLDFAKKHPKP